MDAKLAPSTNLLALPEGTELVGDYRLKRVLGAGGFGITYLADEKALGRLVTIKEYFPAEFAARRDTSAVPRSRGVADDYQWGLDRFIEEAQTLARFDHPHIVRVHRYFRANNTGYMVLHFEEGGSFKAWLKRLNRAPRQAELDRMIAPLLDALEIIHNANFLHRDIAPDNIMVRKDGSPVLIDFGSARGAVASHSSTLSALVKPGYSPYEQYATTGANQGPWTDIYALGATLYFAVAGRRPPDAPTRVLGDEYVPAREAALGSYRASFLEALDRALSIEVSQRPQCIAEWRGPLLAPEPGRRSGRTAARAPRGLGRVREAAARAVAASAPKAKTAPPDVETRSASVPESLVPTPPDAPQRKGQLLDFIEALKKHRPGVPAAQPEQPPPQQKKTTRSSRRAQVAPVPVRPAAATGRAPSEPQFGLGYGPAPPAAARARSQAAAPARPQAAPPPALPVPVQSPAAPASAAERRRRWRLIGSRRRRIIPSRGWRRAIIRVAAAVAVASLAVAYQENAIRSARRDPAPAAAPAVAGTAIFAAAPLQLVGHHGPVVGVASGDGGRWIVSAGADATIRLWSAASGSLVRTIDLPEGPATAFAAEERRALVGHKGGTVVLWDLELAEKVATFQLGGEPITSVAFVGTDLAVAAHAGGGIVELNLAAPGAAPASITGLDGQEDTGPLVAVARSGGMLASSGRESAIRLWRSPGPHLVRTYRLTDDSTAIDIAPDAGYVAGGSIDGTVRVWRSPGLRGLRSRAVQTVKAHEGRVTAVALGALGVLASAGEDGGVKLWTLRPARLIRSLPGGPVRTLSFSGDGRRLFTGGQDGTIRVWPVTLPPASGAI